MWLSIVAEILKVLGPLLLKKLEDWLSGRLKAKATEFEAKGLSPVGTEPDSGALLRAVRGDLWPWQLRRRAFLDAAIESVPPAVAGRQPLSDASKRGLSALALAAN